MNDPYVRIMSYINSRGERITEWMTPTWLKRVNYTTHKTAEFTDRQKGGWKRETQ